MDLASFRIITNKVQIHYLNQKSMIYLASLWMLIFDGTLDGAVLSMCNILADRQYELSSCKE